MLAGAERQHDPLEAVRSLRAIRRRELLRIAVGEMYGETEVADVGAALSRVTDATLEATLDVAGRSVREQRGLDEAPTRIAVVAMGRYGGFELSYGSDADVLFVHEPTEGADAEATPYAMAVANELRRLLIAPASDPPLVVDADLRPEGKQSGRPRPSCAPTRWSVTRRYASASPRWSTRSVIRPTGSAPAT